MLPVPTLASRGTRFAARLIDNVIPIGLVVLLVDAEAMFASPGLPGYGDFSMALRELSQMVVILGIFTVLQWVLISFTGQSIGKKLLGIKIITDTNEEVGFVSGVVLREWVIGFLSGLPFVGIIIAVADAIVIFGESQSCIHDMIASTKVVTTESLHEREAAAHAIVPSTQPLPVDGQIQVLARQGRSKELLDVYKAASSRGGVYISDRSFLVVEQAAAAEGEAELAVSVVRSMLAEHPRSGLLPRALWDTAQLQRRAGRADLADRTLDTLVARFPDDPFARQARADPREPAPNVP